MKGHFVYGRLRIATGTIFAVVLESPKSFTGTRHVRSCLIIIINIAAREHPRAGSKQMATYEAVVAQTQSSSSSSNLCCLVATQNRVSWKSRLKTIRRLNPLVIFPAKVRNSFQKQSV